ncbi:uncharacterized protein LOC105392299 [Plutella xylostella]|uniref:uncharacterized protein LOC105392299 n=1 Tax=Plutella xylostella TaxID=51655 RepID=UPI0020327CB5|nr:uncharacterized protein LOC105392299 [Plutella xylostella]
MNSSNLSIAWNSYQNNLSNGITHFQRDGEFVDMTLAADGHYVTVHQMVIALASPYLKGILSNMHCRNPVIYLHNFSYEILCYTLEYMYSGEVVVPKNKLEKFVECAKSLHLRGIESLPNMVVDLHKPAQGDCQKPDSWQLPEPPPLTQNFNILPVSTNIQKNDANKNEENQVKFQIDCPISKISETNTHENISHLMETEQEQSVDDWCVSNCPIIDLDNLVKVHKIPEKDMQSLQTNSNELPEQFALPDLQQTINIDLSDDYNQEISSNIGHKHFNIIAEDEIPPSNQSNEELENAIASIGIDVNPQPNVASETATDLDTLCDADIRDQSKPQYTVSSQGSKQMILNRYMYYIHHSSVRGFKKRWRCVDYRRKKCTALVDTEGEKIVKRLNTHCHPFHDKKILDKVSKKMVFTSLPAMSESANPPKIRKVTYRETDSE